jgi:8-oxo-dGTP diphosphatase
MDGNGSVGRPVLGVSALIVDGGNVLLVKRGKPPLMGYWSLPGGHVEGGETLAAAAAREVLEETAVTVGGLKQIETLELIDVAERRHVVLVVFRGSGRGMPVAGDDATEARWTPLKEVADLNMVDDTKRLIARHA